MENGLINSYTKLKLEILFKSDHNLSQKCSRWCKTKFKIRCISFIIIINILFSRKI